MSLVEQELPILMNYLTCPLVFSRVRVALSLVFCVVFYRSLFVLLSLLFWSLYCLSFCDIQILITPLVSSNSSVTIESLKMRSLGLHVTYKILPDLVPVVKWTRSSLILLNSIYMLQNCNILRLRHANNSIGTNWGDSRLLY